MKHLEKFNGTLTFSECVLLYTNSKHLTEAVFYEPNLTRHYQAHVEGSGEHPDSQEFLIKVNDKDTYKREAERLSNCKYIPFEKGMTYKDIERGKVYGCQAVIGTRNRNCKFVRTSRIDGTDGLFLVVYSAQDDGLISFYKVRGQRFDRIVSDNITSERCNH